MELTRRHYNNRIELLTAQVNYADGKAVAYFEECRTLAFKLESYQSSQAQRQEVIAQVRGEKAAEVRALKERIASLEEDLTVTQRNYEDQARDV